MFHLGRVSTHALLHKYLRILKLYTAGLKICGKSLTAGTSSSTERTVYMDKLSRRVYETHIKGVSAKPDLPLCTDSTK